MAKAKIKSERKENKKVQGINRGKAAAFWKDNQVWILGAFVGIVTFICIYGVQVLNVTYIDWLLGGGNLTQNYLGWCFYRDSPWTFPIGLMDRMTYPNEVSMIYTDSIPLAAVFFKLFRGILPDRFQYFGLWGAMCFGAQGAFGALLIHHYVRKRAEAVVGSLLFVITPVMLAQVTVNLALGAQWLILCSFYLGIQRKEMTEGRSAGRWGLLGALAAGSQLYFIPLCGLVLVSFLLSDALRRKRVRQDLAGLLAYLAASVGTVALLGGFSHTHIPDMPSLEQAGFNLNGLLNPQGWSQVLPSLETCGSKAEEGLAFPGTGVLLTLAAGGLAWLIHFCLRLRAGYIRKTEGEKTSFLRGFRLDWKKKENGTAWLILILFCLAVAVSPRVACGSEVVMRIGVPDWLLGLWQRVSCCGRFIWPVVYLIILGSVVWMEKEMPWEAMAAVLLVVFSMLQVADGKWQLMQRKVQFSTDYEYISRLSDDVWKKWAQNPQIDHVVFVSYMVDDRELVYELSAYAAENGMTVNDFVTSCPTIRTAASEDLLEALTEVRGDTLYIYKSSDRSYCIDPRMEYVEADGLIVGVAY